MRCSRRGFIGAGLAGLAAAGTQGCASLFCGGPKPRLGVQLYSVRGIAGKDVPGILKALKGMGYEGVEFAGYYGKSAGELRRILDGCGLAACGSHIDIGQLRPGRIDKTVAFARELGNRHIVLPWFNSDTADGWKGLAETLNAAAEKAKPAGISVGYHNHQHEFQKIGGKYKYELLFENLSPDVFLQMDVGHVVSAGQDPVKWLRAFKNPALTLHAKETYPGPGILGRPGRGKKGVDWDALFPVAEREKGLRWYIVETEGNPNTLDLVRESIGFLKEKGR